MKAVSVIIPAYNEEKTIGQVIDIVNASNMDCEIIVVNNCCTDKTSEVATKKGAKVVYSQEKGKGYAMEAGLKVATNEIVVFLDADITDYDKSLINLLVAPIFEKNVDFVKSTFERTKGGLVTNIAVKPLLDILFPEMYPFSEPLSGMIASKKSILEKIEFEKDYGVDIGIILDITNLKLTMAEVNIGKIENMSHVLKTTESMQNMSTQVMRAILKRAKYVK